MAGIPAVRPTPNNGLKGDMSNDPFPSGNPTGNSGVAGGQPGAPVAPKSRRTCLWIVALLLGGGLFCLIICCGVGLYGVQNYGSAIFEPIRSQLNQMAELRSEVGEIESLSMNVFATVEEGKANPEFMILDGKSEKGDFQLSIKMTNAGELQKVFLVMPDGSRKPIDMDNRVSSTTVVPPPGAEGGEPSSDEQEGNGPPSGVADSEDGDVLDPTERELRELESELDLN